MYNLVGNFFDFRKLWINFAIHLCSICHALPDFERSTCWLWVACQSISICLLTWLNPAYLKEKRIDRVNLLNNDEHVYSVLQHPLLYICFKQRDFFHSLVVFKRAASFTALWPKFLTFKGLAWAIFQSEGPGNVPLVKVKTTNFPLKLQQTLPNYISYS